MKLVLSNYKNNFLKEKEATLDIKKSSILYLDEIIVLSFRSEIEVINLNFSKKCLKNKKCSDIEKLIEKIDELKILTIEIYEYEEDKEIYFYYQ